MASFPIEETQYQQEFSTKLSCDSAETKVNDETETINDKEDGKPLSFLDKVALDCQKMTIKCNNNNTRKSNCKYHSYNFDKFIDDPKTSTSKNKGDAGRESNELDYFLSKICSLKDYPNAATKLQLLTSLTNICKERSDLYEMLGSSPLVYYAESLLLTYSEVLYLRTNHRKGIIANPSPSDLILLIPILKLLIPAANMTVHKIRSIFLYRTEVLSQLMRASAQCSYNAMSTLSKLRTAVSGKVLAGALLEMTSSDTQALFYRCFGINTSSLNLNLIGYHVTLYNTCGANEININLEIIQNRPPSGREYTQSRASYPKFDSNVDCCKNIDTADWSDIIVAQVLLLKTALVYTREDWKEQLVYINSEVQEHLRKVNTPLENLQIGTVYGFWSLDATFEGKAFLMVQCLRGQVLTLTGDWAMFWAVDIGLIGYIPKAKFCSLPEDLASQSPLISICSFRGPVCDMDEAFLETAYQLLQIILETNAQFGKHMLLCESGEHILALLEYPEDVIRIAFLDLLLCLAKNSKDVVKFLFNHQFDITLIGKLERFCHIYAADLYNSKNLIEKEIEQMVKILKVILEQKEDITKWAENRRVSRVLWMLLCSKNCIWKLLLEKCLSLLSGKLAQKQHNLRGGFRNSYQQKWRRGWQKRNERQCGSQYSESISQAGFEMGMNYRDRKRTDYSRGWRQFRDNNNPKHIKRNGSDFTYQQSKVQRHLEIPLCEMSGDRSKLQKSQMFNPDEESITENMKKQSTSEVDFTDKWKSDFQKDDDLDRRYKTREISQIELETQEDKQLMSRMDGKDRTRLYNTSQTKYITSRLSKFNTLKPPTSVINRVSATYHEVLNVCEDSTPVSNDMKSVTEQMGEVSLDSDSEYVMRGSKATVESDKTHVLILVTELWEIKEVVLAQKLCGLLNNNVEGSMYFGLNADSIIEGVKLGREDKDVFRNGIDRIMNRCLIPEVRANSYDILFTPVLREDEKTVDLSHHWLYIIEIRVRPMMHMVYMVYQGRKCYMRCETETIECTAMQKKQEMMDTEDKALQASIEEMGDAAINDFTSLAEFIQKYLPK